jgi:hypothetical protein
VSLLLVDLDNYATARNRHTHPTAQPNDPDTRLIDDDTRPDNRNARQYPARPDHHEKLQPQQTLQSELPYVGDVDDIGAEVSEPLGYPKQHIATPNN